VTPLLRPLHWLSAPWRINFKLAVLAFKCLHGLAPSYLAVELHHPAETEFRQRLWSLQLCQSPVPDCQPTATELSRSLPLGSGTVFLGTSHPCRHSPPSAFVSRHTIIISVIRSTFVRACEVTLIMDTLIVFTYLLA